MDQSNCPFCNELITWANNVHGKKIPINLESFPNGNLIIAGDVVYKVSPEFKNHHPEEPRYISHIVTCKEKEKWRK